MLKILCVVLVFLGSCIMLSSIIIYKNTTKTYIKYLTTKKGFMTNRHSLIMLMMIFFLLGYITTIFFLIEMDSVDMSMLLISMIFFFGAIFCFSVVYVQSELLNRLELNADELRKALTESENANSTLEKLNNELVTTMDTLQKTQHQLIFSEKMSTLGKMMAGISHEINTPLSVIKSSAEKLENSFSHSLYPILTVIRQLSEESFEDFIRYINIALVNTRQNYSTSEMRAMKRAAKKVLEEVDGFNDSVLELLARNSLLDEVTLTSVASSLASGTFAHILVQIDPFVQIVNAIDNISESTGRIVTIVSSMKSYSHVNLKNEKLNFNVVNGLKAVLSIFTSQLKFNIEVETNFESVPNINGYEDELSQVWSNLIQNAIYAIQDKNNAPNDANKPGMLIINLTKSGDQHIAVSITDNGVGISEDAIEDIFEPFITTKPTGIGSGLGLSISKQIIEKHNGTINVESEKNRGTTFTVILPI